MCVSAPESFVGSFFLSFDGMFEFQYCEIEFYFRLRFVGCEGITEEVVDNLAAFFEQRLPLLVVLCRRCGANGALQLVQLGV